MQHGRATMSRKTGRAIAASCVLGAVVGVGILIYGVAPGGGIAAQVLPDVGSFKAGSELGMERAGFSGRAMVQVFTQAGSPEWTAISQCLGSAEIEEEMHFFTGVLVDEKGEPGVESVFRERDGLNVVVRGLNGAFLGGLRTGFTCEELLILLRSVRRRTIAHRDLSPIYANLLESAAPITDMVQKGEGDRAARYVDLLKEFEGASSPAVRSAEAALGR
jgi:hypothetical protein